MKSANTLKSPQNKNLTSWSITMQNLINIALAVLKIFRVVKSTTFPGHLTQNKLDAKNGRRKQWSCPSNKFLWLTMTF